ncbi:hypothetical protein ACEPAF_446 [Sanghuangporus sanghuang]
MAEQDGRASPTPTIVSEGSEGHDINEEFQHRLFPGREGHERDEHLVNFEPDDPLNPMNWERQYRWFLTILSGIILFNASFASSAPSGVVEQFMMKYHMSTDVATLTISLFVAGYCVGPILWGPLSEQIGRKPIFVVSFIVYTAFQIGGALADNKASILIFRLLSGIFAAAPLTNSGALISDIWEPATRGKAVALFAVAPFAGPSLGPIVGGYINTAGVSWRWLFWVLAMFAAACTIAIIFLLPETYAPVIMMSKAKTLRLKTGDDKYYAPIERQPKRSKAKYLEDTIARPFNILFREPILLAITMYTSFLYGCIYLLFEAYPIVFREGHGLSTGATGLMFLPFFIGCIVAVLGYAIIFNPRYEREIERYKPNPVPPEARLEVALIGAPLFALGFFWFAWTSYPSISYWAPMLSGLAMGSSSVLIFLSLLCYIIDTYVFVAASALASNTVVRSIFGATFPLFATHMYNGMNPRWASTLLGCVATVMVPVPFILKRYGPAIRKRSKHAPPQPIMEKKGESKV